MYNKEIILNSELDSKLLAKIFVLDLTPNNVVTFSGELGAGKTFICREIIKYFCGNNVNIISPTYNLLQTYKTSEFTIYHYDLYRLKYLEEIYELAIEDALESNLCLIEWPEIIESILPLPIIKIYLNIIGNNKRPCSINYL